MEPDIFGATQLSLSALEGSWVAHLRALQSALQHVCFIINAATRTFIQKQRESVKAKSDTKGEHETINEDI